MASERVDKNTLVGIPLMTMACYIDAHKNCPNAANCQCSCHPPIYTQADLDAAVAQERDTWRQWLLHEFDIDLTLSDDAARADLLERDEMMRADYSYLRNTVMPKEIAAERERCAGIAETMFTPTEHGQWDTGYVNAGISIATAIRAQEAEATQDGEV